MPNFGLTPEALLGRNDSKNPATTCKGVTSSGRSCRRALSAAKVISSKHSRNGDVYQHPSDLYCWQHKDQAVETVVAGTLDGKPGRPGIKTEPLLGTVQERSSIDTLVQRLGINSAPVTEIHAAHRPSDSRRPRPTEYQDVGKSKISQAPHAEKYGLGHAPPRKTQQPGFWATLCCVVGDQDDYVEIVRHKKRVSQSRPTNSATTAASTPSMNLPIRQRHDSEIDQLFSLIPSSLAPQAASALLAELAKPLSPHDEEGYIYIFWLTPQSKQTPPTETARSLLTPNRPNHERRLSDVMSEFSVADDELTTRGKKTIMLKIGRANNVTRRMNEWQRQCGYALNLVRWYPHVSSASNNPSPTRPSPARSPNKSPLNPDLTRPPTSRHDSETVRKVPSVKRVERLVHLELVEKRLMRHCDNCHKEHREWFEVEASQNGVREVDACIRRWIGWAEKNDQRVLRD
ncbi:Hypothetical protein R9X50_00008800 [Acrodontium crateriforme]|uniref:Bacteriophage T5 Orf172 DNA-binding domain-containing protein n=1 Tax=Acrodontium crateriforme TaxID=150365 RepID=A0AAQ3R6U7_9PEZI|nr:Hypothetical protein R9X50_00008800 [Acrodontium crateriforme]